MNDLLNNSMYRYTLSSKGDNKSEAYIIISITHLEPLQVVSHTISENHRIFRHQWQDLVRFCGRDGIDVILLPKSEHGCLSSSCILPGPASEVVGGHKANLERENGSFLCQLSDEQVHVGVF